MAKPTADSAPATVSMYKAKAIPPMSFKYTANMIKYSDTANKSNSNEIRILMSVVLKTKIPHKATLNK